MESKSHLRLQTWQVASSCPRGYSSNFQRMEVHPDYLLIEDDSESTAVTSMQTLISAIHKMDDMLWGVHVVLLRVNGRTLLSKRWGDMSNVSRLLHAVLAKDYYSSTHAALQRLLHRIEACGQLYDSSPIR
jgi:hypothetical protein